jgi:transcriptional regulator with XRE-family HTH domain
MNARALVARNLRRWRVAAGISQEALAVDAGIDRTYVSRVERGLENPTVAVLEKMARALSIRIVDFFAPPVAGPPPSTLRAGRKPRKAVGRHGKPGR